MFEAAEFDHRITKEEYDRRMPALREGLLEAQARLAEADFSVVVVVAGAEGSGKGETVNTLLEWMDARGIEAHALGAPSEEERERPEFYRFWRRLPPAGRIGIFFGSWYTRPIVERSFKRIGGGRFDRALGRIDDFERMLTDERVLVVKFWLHVTKKQQRRRFEKLESDPDSAWRVTPLDWEYHSTYDPFERSAARALRRTDTPHAPWHVIAARRRRYRNLTVGERLLETLEKRLDAGPSANGGVLPPHGPPKLEILRSLDLSQRTTDDEYEPALARSQAVLARQARRLADAGCSAVVVFEGQDAAGKGGCLRRVVAALDARFYRVIPIAAPTDEERVRPYLWRFWRQLPRLGHVTLYDRSWYGRVLVERVEGFCEPRAWQRAYAEINAFEEQLVEAGTLVFKFWLQTSAEEQLRRFREREATGHKRYKITDEDWRNREKWPAYEAAICDMVERTSTEIAPWQLVPAEDKRVARLRVLEALCDGLERAVGVDRPPRKGRRR